jgi:hypothetical protein
MPLLANLPHLCNVRRRVRSQDSIGGAFDQPDMIKTDVACWVQGVGANEIAEYEQRSIKITNKIYFSSDPGIKEEDQIIVTKRNGSILPSPAILEVRSRFGPDVSVGLGILFKVMVEEITAYENNDQ